jgi:hypothetical protein
VCWSGERSRQVAEILDERLRELLGQSFEVFRSTQIEKGSVWFDEVTAALDVARAGLICLTPENRRAPWLHFEVGALARKLRDGGRQGSIFTFLLEPSELESPLSAYQATVAERADTYRLVESIVRAMGLEGAAKDWGLRYDGWWRELRAELDRIETPWLPLPEVVRGFEDLFRRKTFDEPLTECTHQRWIDRYGGARVTATALDGHLERVKAECRPHVDVLFRDLRAQVDAYAMDLEAFLVSGRRFGYDDEGRVRVVPRGAEVALERRRRDIKVRVAQLLDPAAAPCFEEACRFELVETFAEKKNLIHRKHDELEARGWPVTDEDREDLGRAMSSDWPFDRIVSYLVREGDKVDVATALGQVRREVERVNAQGSGASHMALHYSLRLPKKAIEPGVDGSTADHVVAVLELVRRAIEGRDAGGQIAREIDEIRVGLGLGPTAPLRAAAADDQVGDEAGPAGLV